MFENLPATRGSRRSGRTGAMAVALLLHVLAGVLFGAASLLAAEPIEPPSLPVVFCHVHLRPAPPPPPDPGPPRRREPTPRRPNEPRASTTTVQPVQVPESPALPETPQAAGGGGGEDRQDPTTIGESDGVAGGVPGGVPGAAGPSGAGGSQSEPLPVGGDVVSPVILTRVEPRYPEPAKLVQAQGLVVLEAIINTEGQIEDVKVLRGHPQLDAAAIEAILQWRFRPGLLNGKPVRVYFTVTVNFVLK